MKLCRFDEDRLGVVIGDKVHDVTDLQTQIRAAARYDMKGDAVIAALRRGAAGSKRLAPRHTASRVRQWKLISPVAASIQDHGGASQLRQAH